MQADLDAALPLVEKAKAALQGLNLKDFQTLKVMGSPPEAVNRVFTCVLHLLSKIDDNVPVDNKGKLKHDQPWKVAQKLMQNPGAFLNTLNEFKGLVDEDKVPANNFKNIRPFLADEEFTPEIVKGKSSCAAGVCDWIINITAYYDVVVSVEPKKQAVREATETLEAANTKKATMDELVAKLNADLAVLQAQFQAAMDEKNAAEAEAARCERRLNLAQRLVNALGSESARWAEAIITLGQQIEVIVGDVLLASAFVSYVGPFNKKFRNMILKDNFAQFFIENKIPVSPALNPLPILTDEAQIAVWNNQKLPQDEVSTENGAILMNSERYSLIIDPQLQGITWLKEREKDSNLQVTRLSNPKIIKTVEFAVEGG